MDIKQVNSAIMFGSFSNEELSSIVDAVRFARENLLRQKIRTVSVGSQVLWTCTRNPHPVRGTVEKINRKFVVVRTPLGELWKVPANMLQPA